MRVKLSSREREVLAALTSTKLVQCLANSKEQGRFYPSHINGIRLTKGLIGGLEAKGMLRAERCPHVAERLYSFQLTNVAYHELNKGKHHD